MENDMKIKLPFLNRGKETELPNLNNLLKEDIELAIDIQAIYYAIEQEVKALGLNRTVFDKQDYDVDRRYWEIFSLKANIKETRYILKRLDPKVTDKQIDDYAKEHKGFYSEIVLRTHPKENGGDFQKPAKPANKKQKTELSKNS